jgi:hypothetical protein
VSESEIKFAIPATQKIRKIHENASFHACWGIFRGTSGLNFKILNYTFQAFGPRGPRKKIQQNQLEGKKYKNS